MNLYSADRPLLPAAALLLLSCTYMAEADTSHSAGESSLLTEPLIICADPASFDGQQWFDGEYGATMNLTQLPYFITSVTADLYYATAVREITGKGIGGFTFVSNSCIGTALRLISDHGGLFTWRSDFFSHCSVTSPQVTFTGFIPQAELSRYSKGCAAFPLTGWKCSASLPLYYGTSYTHPAAGIRGQCAVWKEVGSRFILTVQQDAGISLTPEQSAVCTFFLTYPGVKPFTCDSFVTFTAGFECITCQHLLLSSFMPYNVFGSLGLFMHAGLMSPTSTTTSYLPVAVEITYSFVPVRDGIVQNLPINKIGFGYAFDGTPSWGPENSTVTLFAGLNY